MELKRWDVDEKINNQKAGPDLFGTWAPAVFCVGEREKVETVKNLAECQP